MIINAENLAAMFTAFDLAFKGALEKAPSKIDLIASEIKSSGASTKFPLGALTATMRAWTDDRHITNIAA